ncbi:MAG TPA: M14 metallopeptidase family protein, partial [Thermoanaerobaculia bacterium]
MRSTALGVLLLSAALPLAAQKAPSPSEFLGFEVGADRKLADYRQMTSYFRALEKASPRLRVVSLGKTTLGEDMLMLLISSPENLGNIAQIKADARRLADPRGLSAAEVDDLVERGRVFVLVTCNIHSTEIASTQMAMEWAHALATSEDPATLRRLSEVVLMLVPSLNPDGQIMETEWYRKYLGTPLEGGRMPKLYHHYVGHDNNRDWFMLTQKETRALSRAIYQEYFPQVFVDEHQMGTAGPRMFIPPFADPMDPDVHPLIWREANLIGTNMAFRLEQAGKAGLISGYSFDAYWLGGTRNTGWWKNITGLLLEIASARMATPVYVDPTELSGGSKGLVDYKAQANFPNPWKGGWWRMRDVMDYERIASDALLEIVAERREDFLRNLLTRARAAVAAFGAKDAYRIPMSQRDPATARRMTALLAEHGVEVRVAENGDFWIPLAQPYSRFVVEMLEPQRYPEVRLQSGADILQPYDIATWTLPLMMGVRVDRAELPDGTRTASDAIVRSSAALVSSTPLTEISPSPESARAINAALKAGIPVSAAPNGAALLDTKRLATLWPEIDTLGLRIGGASALPPGTRSVSRPRVAIYKPWAASMDEGWTRWLLEQYGFEPKSLDNAAIRAGELAKNWDAIILPDVEKEVIATGRPRRPERGSPYFAELPPEFKGGLEKEGSAALKQFVEQGGTLIAFANSTAYVIDELALPVRNAVAGSRSEEFSCPGSLVRVSVRPDHPVTAGMPAETAVFLDDAFAFQTQIPAPETGRAVLAAFP